MLCCGQNSGLAKAAKPGAQVSRQKSPSATHMNLLKDSAPRHSCRPKAPRHSRHHEEDTRNLRTTAAPACAQWPHPAHPHHRKRAATCAAPSHCCKGTSSCNCGCLQASFHASALEAGPAHACRAPVLRSRSQPRSCRRARLGQRGRQAPAAALLTAQSRAGAPGWASSLPPGVCVRRAQ